MRRSVLLALVAAVAVAAYSGNDNPYPQADPVDGTFCDRLISANGYDYTNPDHGFAMMLLLVQRAYNGATRGNATLPPVIVDVQGLVNNVQTASAFNGAIQYRESNNAPVSPYHDKPTYNFKTDLAAAHALDLKLVSWFGKAFNCSGSATNSTGFTERYPYTGSNDMVSVHANMGITQLQFAAFSNQFALSTQSLGVSQLDFAQYIAPYLQSFGRGATNKQAICTYTSSDPSTDCQCGTGWTGADCATAVKPTDPVINPGNGPTPANFGANPASTLMVSLVSVVAAATIALAAMRM